MTQPPPLPPPPTGRGKARRRRRQVPALLVVSVLAAAAAVTGVIFLLQLLEDEPITTSQPTQVTVDPRSGLSVGHAVSSLNGVDVPLPEGFRLEYEAFYPHEDVGLLIAHNEQIAHRAQVFTFLEPGTSNDAAEGCTSNIDTLAPQLSGTVHVGPVERIEASGEVEVARCSASGENLDLGIYHYEYLAFRLPDGGAVLQQTRVPDLQLQTNAEQHETYRQYFTCVIDDRFDVGLPECA